MRGADGGPLAALCALPAFWAGLLYDDAALDAAWELVRGWTAEERDRLARRGAAAGACGGDRRPAVRDVARDVLAIAEPGLKARAFLNERGEDESVYLAPLFEIVESGVTSAERLLERYRGDWKGSVAPAFAECVF